MEPISFVAVCFSILFCFFFSDCLIQSQSHIATDGQSVSLSVCLCFFLFESYCPESESYVTTDGQPAGLSWNKTPIWDLRPDLYYCMKFAGLLIGAPSLTRGRVCRLQLLLALASAVIFGSESYRTRGHILLSQIWDFPFRRLLWLAGSRWRYSTPPPHGLLQLLSCPYKSPYIVGSNKGISMVTSNKGIPVVTTS
jgi:hypothetical protein